MVGLSAEEQFRRRARKALAAGEPFEARGEVNKRLLEEVRAEVEQGKASIRAQASKGVKRVRKVSAEEEARIKQELNAAEARIKEELKAEGAAQRRLMAEETAALAACPPGALRASTAEGSGGGSSSDGAAPEAPAEAPAEEPEPAPTVSQTAAHFAMPPMRCAAPAPEAAREDMGAVPAPAEKSQVLTQKAPLPPSAQSSVVAGESALHQQPALPTGTAAEHPTLPQTLAKYSPKEQCRLEREATEREYQLQQEAQYSRLHAAEQERARLAPEESRHFRQAYERLAVQHDWPALPEGGALPNNIAESQAWFFREGTQYRKAFFAKMTAAMPKKATSQCRGCQDNAAEMRAIPEARLPWVPGAWDFACARHKALSAVDEVRLESAFRLEWAEPALLFAVASQKRQAEEAERQRLASKAREAQARQEQKRRRAVEEQARKELNPKASKCRKCEEADFAWGGLCPDHQEELQSIEARLNEESVVPQSGSDAESSDSE